MVKVFERNKSVEIVFGPVDSRRFGRSLGVDLSPSKKQCNFDCVYCELQGARTMERMEEIVPVDSILQAVQVALQTQKCDVLTLTANGEPTLYPYLYELISNLKKIVPDSVKMLILTNGSLLWKKEVQDSLMFMDIVKFSCDSLESRAFKRIDRPHSSLNLTQIKQGIREFCQKFKGDIVSEVLFVKGINDTMEQAKEIALFLSTLKGLKRVDIGSIDRPPAYKVEAVSDEKLKELASCFYAYPHLNISLPKRTQNEKKENLALQAYDTNGLIGLIKRRPLSILDAEKMLDSKTLALLYELCQKNIVKQCSVGKNIFYQIVE